MEEGKNVHENFYIFTFRKCPKSRFAIFTIPEYVSEHMLAFLDLLAHFKYFPKVFVDIYMYI